MIYTNWMFIFALALQLAGAIILVLNNLRKRDFNKLVEDERTKMIVAKSKKRGKKKAGEMLSNLYIMKCTGMYRNIFAFVFLILGYIISIWGTNDYDNKIYILVWVVTICAILCLIACMVAEVMGKFVANKRCYSNLQDEIEWGVVEDSVDCEKILNQNPVEEKDKINGLEEGKKDSIQKYDFEKKTKIIVTIISILATCYLIINEIYKYLYRVNCESIYMIPRTFFESDIKDKFIHFSMGMLLIILIIFPSIMRGIINRSGDIKGKKEGKVGYMILSILLGLVYGLVNMLFVMRIPTVRNILIDDGIGSWLCLMLLLFFGVVSVCGVTLAPELQEAKEKKHIKAYWHFWIASLCITVFLFVTSLVSMFDVPIQDKVEYEFVLNAEKNYVVLADIGDNVLVVEYQENNGEMIFYTKCYSFLERNKYNYAYGYLKEPPTIKYEIKPEESNEGMKSADE